MRLRLQVAEKLKKIKNLIVISASGNYEVASYHDVHKYPDTNDGWLAATEQAMIYSKLQREDLNVYHELTEWVESEGFETSPHLPHDLEDYHLPIINKLQILHYDGDGDGYRLALGH